MADLTTSTKKKLRKIPQESHVGLPPTAPALSKSNTKKGHGYFSTSSARNLLTSRRIIDSFNVGDLAEIQKIVDDTVTLDCDVYVFPLNQRMRGRNALMDLWESMLEAFPDGVFRASDTTINDKGELTTRFIFTGAKQFNIRLGNTSLCGREFGEIIPIDMQHSNNDGYSYCDSSSSSSSSSDIGVRSSCSGTLKSISNDDEDAAKTDFHNSNSRIAPPINAKSAMGSRKSKKELSLNNSKTTSNIFEANMATIGVDYSVPLIRSADLLVDDALEEVYRGSMIMHTNGQYQIDRLDYHWTKNP